MDRQAATGVSQTGLPAPAGAWSAPAPSGADRPLLLWGRRAWHVVSGCVDVFSVPVENGRPSGPRTHLLSLGAGGTLFGADAATGAAAWGLLAVGHQGTSLASAAMPDGAAGAGWREAVEAWVEALCDAMVRGGLADISTLLAPGGELEVAQGASVRVAGRVGWVRHLEGYSRLMGRAGLEVADAGPVPLAESTWLQAGASSRVQCLETAVLDVAELWDGLDRLHDLALRFVGLAAAQADGEAREGLTRRARFRDSLLREAYDRLASTLAAPKSARAGRPVSAPADPLLAACVLVGEAAGIEIKGGAPDGGGARARDPLASILRASRIRARQVALRDDWWRRDNGPLLAFDARDRRPVALLPLSRGRGYVRHDPAGGTPQRVDARAAETIHPLARGFYRSFPERRLAPRDLLRFGLHGCRRDIVVVSLVAVCAALLAMAPSVATGMVFSTVIPGAQRYPLLQLTLVLLATAFALALFNLAQGIALLRIEGRASAALQSAVWDRLLALPLSFFRPYTSGELATRAMAIDAIRQLVSGATAAALVGSIQALGNFALMYWYSPRMAVWATGIIALVALVTVAGSALQLRPQREAMKLQARVAGLVLQLLSSVSKLRTSGAEVAAFALWVRRFSEQRRVQYEARVTGNWVAGLNTAVPIASSLLIFYLALPLVAEGRQLGTGDFLAFLAAYSASSGAFLATASALLATLNALPLYEQAKPILETLPEVDPDKGDPGVLTGDIEVQHATFRYREDGPLVLRDVSFSIRAGEFVAFVGPSGSGKSTLLRLLLGFESPEAGAVYYDGQQVAGLDVQALRRQLGTVLQSGRLMSGDVFTNIAGSSAASLEEAWEAARMSGLAEDIEAMPMGMHTVISEGAGTLSGGQRQRLLIARAIVNRPRILLFDEATSALDNRTQSVVSASLEKLQATRVVVAHRLSTIVNADRIFVMDRGRLVQSGRYDELMAQPGPFVELARRQIA